MDTLLKYLVLGAIAVGLIGCIIEGWERTVGDHYREQQAAKDAPVIANLKAQLAGAQSDNKRLSDDVDALRDRYNALFKEGKDRQAQSDAQVAAAKANAAKSDAALAEVQALLKRAPSTEPCTGICANADAILRDAITEDAAP